jgi:endonuclease/exonuclease/phosphatase family metal-dependent hydrolase
VPPRLRVLTANLRLGRADPGAFAALVRRLEPDAVCVQELGPSQAAALGAVLPHGRLDAGVAWEGMGIALRRPGEVTLLPLPRVAGYVTEIRGVELINLHVSAPHAPPLWPSLWWRSVQLRRLLAHLDAAPGRPRVVAGDLNSTPLWPFYRRLVTRLEDAALLAARAAGRRPAPTWGRWSGGRPVLRIDHVLVSGLVAVAVEVHHVAGSDHSAVMAELEAAPDRRPA